VSCLPDPIPQIPIRKPAHPPGAPLRYCPVPQNATRVPQLLEPPPGHARVSMRRFLLAVLFVTLASVVAEPDPCLDHDYAVKNCAPRTHAPLAAIATPAISSHSNPALPSDQMPHAVRVVGTKRRVTRKSVERSGQRSRPRRSCRLCTVVVKWRGVACGACLPIAIGASTVLATRYISPHFTFNWPPEPQDPVHRSATAYLSLAIAQRVRENTIVLCV
jgi:hypothetical protein